MNSEEILKEKEYKDFFKFVDDNDIAIRKFIEQSFRKNMYKFSAKGFSISEEDKLGCGFFGCVYGTDDPYIVLKITCDPFEANNYDLVYKNVVKSRIFPKVYGIFTQEKKETDIVKLYFIFKENLKELNNDEQELWASLQDTKMPCFYIRELINKVIKYESKTCGLICWYQVIFDKYPETLKFVKELIRVCATGKMYITDLHSGNVRKRISTGEWVISDFSSRTSISKDPELLGLKGINK